MSAAYTSYRQNVGELQLQVSDWGKARNSPLIMLHGLASTAHMFDLIAPQLSDHYHVIAYDQRGHGQSDKPNQGYDFEQLATDLDHLLTALNIDQPITLLGHSWGAFTTLYYAATRPNKIKHLVLLDGGTMRFAERFSTLSEVETALAPPLYKNRSLESIKQMIQHDWLDDAFRSELEPLALSVFDINDRTNVKPHLSRENHMEIVHAMYAFDPVSYYPKIMCKTLIINAINMNGSVTQSDEVQLAYEGIKDVNVITMEDTIHDIPWHRPRELTTDLKNALL